MCRAPDHPHPVSHPCVSNTLLILRLREISQSRIFGNQVSRRIRVLFFLAVTASGTYWRRRLGQTEIALLVRSQVNERF